MTTYITTPIYYVNAQPHLGHAYTTIVADTYARFSRLAGHDTRFQTGTDEHGDKIMEAAAKNGKSPREYVDEISAMFRDSWPLLNIKYDRFIRTTDEDHIRTVQDILQKVYDSGDIYFDAYSGLYCKGCERFLTEKELADGKCPDHLTEPQAITEENYFFRMSRYQQQLIDHIRANPDFITPERYRNEVLSFLSEPLEDLCISRPKSRLTWGIELPFDPKFVTYVWFDALINYLTGIDYPEGSRFEKYWPATEHVIAKDILKPHAIYWPTMLLSMGLPLYKKLHVHGYWNVDDTKMSKSIGNVVRPAEIVAEYGLDTFRYFALREMSFGLDASFGEEVIIARKNSDLANDLGNLYSRSTAMLQKYCGGVVPKPYEAPDDLSAAAEKMLPLYTKHMAAFEFHKGLQAVWELIGFANKYIVTNEPWVLAKDAGQRERLDAVMYNLAECLRMLALVLAPVMPDTSAKMLSGLGLAQDDPAACTLEAGGKWGILRAGIRLNEIEPLFPRTEKKKADSGQKPPQKNKQEVKPPAAKDGLVSFAHFQDLELRVAEIIAAEKIAKSDKLLKLTVKAPEKRTIVAGIAKHYSPEELIGRQVVIVANLKPVMLMGVESQGMILAAKTKTNGEEHLALTAVDKNVQPGDRVA
ncbi:MAG: methionine--tRNA ligase [Deltaproteobacteria bacterium]|nr:MAG: methionine--tRNA ligase [Deltaproteobacteria bacterium]